PIQPQVALLLQLRNRVAREEVGRDALARRLAGHRLGAVLTELRGLAIVVGVRPGAARAVEAVLLVQGQQRAQAALDPHLAHPTPRGLPDRVDAGGAAMPPGGLGAR